MKKQFDLSIDHKMLEGAKGGFDTCLKIAVAKALATGSNEGSATLRVSFEIHNGVDSETGETYMLPEIKYKAGYSVPMKDGIEGKVIEASRLIRKNDGGFSLVNEQVSMDELMDDDDEQVKYFVNGQPLAEVR